MATMATKTTARPKAASQTDAAATDGGGGGVIPFVRGSGLGRYKFYDKSGLTLTTNTQDLGPINVKAYDYMRSIVVQVTATSAGGGSGVTTVEDGPFNALSTVEVLQPNGQTLYKVSSGYSAAQIHKHGGYAGYNDPRNFNQFAYSTGSGTAPTLTYAFRIPFEINARDALGSLPNKDAAAPFTLNLTLNTLANVFGGSPTTPTLRVQCWLEAWDQPPSELDGESVETTPPAMNTLQRWTEQQIAVNAGQFDAQLKKMGNYIRMIIPIIRRSGSTRANGDSDWPDPLQIVLDEDVKDNISKTTWLNDIYEKWGYGKAGTTADTAEGRDNGVLPYDYCHEFDGRVGHELGDLYLPTIESEEYLLRGSWGNAGTITCLVCEILPNGNIFS
jgi:hypothetical protein